MLQRGGDVQAREHEEDIDEQLVRLLEGLLQPGVGCDEVRQLHEAEPARR